ncbi:potassium-transporting ATPase subunit KdpA, partial [Pseudomonas aeruginosa]|uniref:potassium-transporting ATPase subunit KdpA n=1 Tax=Pseudomonas aeruginosa TaxID=287 RepID=UPI003CC6907A
VFTFGNYVKDLRQSRAILGCMLLLFCICQGQSLWAEYQPNPALAQLPIEQGAPMEGKECRFGTAARILWANTTTPASTGS